VKAVTNNSNIESLMSPQIKFFAQEETKEEKKQEEEGSNH